MCIRDSRETMYSDTLYSDTMYSETVDSPCLARERLSGVLP